MLPTNVRLHKKTAVLELEYADLGACSLDAEFLRVHSPSAEVRGHGHGQEVLQTGKRHVKIDTLETVGNYAIRLYFDDGHASGIYSWEYLRELCKNHDCLWQDYLERLKAAGKHREPGTQVLHFQP